MRESHRCAASTLRKGAGGDEPALGVVHKEVGVAGGRVGAIKQLPAQVEQVLFNIELERAHTRLAAFAARRLVEGMQQVFE